VTGRASQDISSRPSASTITLWPSGKRNFVVLRLDVDPLDAREFLQPGHVDLVVEVADVA